MSVDDAKLRILDRVSLSDLLGSDVALEGRGNRHKGLCPFHQEKTPSFTIYDDRTYHCFGCKEHGDAISWVREKQGLSFMEALRFLAEKYSIEVPELEASKAEGRRRSQDISLYRMMQRSQEFYLENIAGNHGREALAYLQNRGFQTGAIRDFGFGLTPSEPFGLTKYLQAQGYRLNDMSDCSLSTVGAKDGRPIDFLRRRITVPIRDTQGRIIAFGGRTIDDHPAKYINSGNTRLFDKSRTLFGFDKAREAIRQKGRAVVVEGYMDAMQLWAQGFPETVACMGTALTEAHLKLLKNATNKAILLFDGDSAGQNATLNTVAVALQVPQVAISAASLPRTEDPDSFVKKEGSEALEVVIAKAIYLFDYAITRKLQEAHGLSIPDLISREFIPWLAKIPDRMQRHYLIGRISRMTSIPSEQIERELQMVLRAAGNRGLGKSYSQAAKRMELAPRALAARDVAGGTRSVGPQSRQDEAKPTVRDVPPPLTDQRLIGLMGHIYFALPKELDLQLLRKFIQRDFEGHPIYIEFLEEMVARLAEGSTPASLARSAWAASTVPEVSKFIDELNRRAVAFQCSNRQEKLNSLINQLVVQKLHATKEKLKAQLSQIASRPHQESEITTILQQIQDLTRSIALDSREAEATEVNKT